MNKMTFGALMTAASGIFNNQLGDLREAHDNRINQIVEDYKDTKNLPRKKKKTERKRLNDDYNFFRALEQVEFVL